MTSDGRGHIVAIAGTVLVSGLMGFWLTGSWPALVMMSQVTAQYFPGNPDVMSEYVNGIGWAFVLTVVVGIWGTLVRFRGPLLTVWFAKVLICIGPMLFYDFSYNVDVDGYFGNARLFGFSPFHIGQGAQTIYNIAWFNLRFLSDSFHSTRLTFALIGMAGVYLVYRSGAILFGRDDPRLFYAMALLPSVLFWSSILGKEPVALFGIGAYVYGVVAWQKGSGVRPLIWVIAGLFVAVYVRVWLGPILVIPLAALGWKRTAGVQRRLVFAAIGLVGVLMSPTLLRDTMGVDISKREEFLESTNSVSRSFGQGGSSLEVPDLGTSASVLMFAPFGIFTVLFRPFPGEVPNLFGFLAGIDNVVMLFLAVRAVRRTRIRDLREPLVLWGLLTVLIWAFVYAIDSFQNLGTASRHRLEITPLMLGVLLYLGRRRDAAGAALAAPRLGRQALVAGRVMAS